MIAQFIKKLRLKHNLTQEYLAKELGITRQTYFQIEKGGRELTISEAKKLATVFGLSFENFLNQKDVDIKVDVKAANKNQPKKGKETIRISIPQKNIKKFKEVLLYILSKIGNKPNIGQSVINKLLYFIDFDYYEKHEEQLIGATYIKNHFGPAPCELLKVIEQMKADHEIEEINSRYFTHDQKKFLPIRKPNLELLSAQEIAHIDEVLNRLSDKSAKEMTDYSHGDIPWLIHQDGEKISYESVFYRDDKYSVRNYDEEPLGKRKIN